MAKKKRIPKHLAMSFNRSLLPVGWKHRKDTLPVNRAELSRSSQNSYSCPSVYEDVHYRCRVCRAKATFTAQAQKHAYEVEKRYIGQRRVYCETCYQRLNALLNELAQCKAQWSDNQRERENDVAFLTDWLAKLNELATFRNRVDWHLRGSLKRRLNTLSESTSHQAK